VGSHASQRSKGSDDPIPTDDVTEASLARVAARIQEQIMTDKQHDPTVRQPRGPLVWVGSLALFGVFALAIGIALANGLGTQTPPPVAVIPTPSEAPVGSSDPVDSGNPAAGGGVASCLVYDPANLPTFDSVFDGTVTAVDGDQVTFKVNEGWKGADGSITLTAPPVDIAISGPLPAFTVGSRYLVTSSGSTISACGYSLDYDADTAATWAAAFGS
jgi:hypothetical protein